MITRIVKKAITGLFILGLSVLHGSPLKSDETVIFFPTSAHLNKDLQWEVPIHHWVFEKEDQSILRKLTHKLLSEVAESLDIPEEQANSELFKKRVMWFIVDNERNKKLDIALEGFVDKQEDIKTLNTSAANGHAKTTIYVPGSSIRSEYLKYRTKTETNEKEASQEFIGQTQLIPKTGLSVISDIDDTIKISEVLDKKALIRNTFLEEYKTTPVMPEYYKRLEKQGAYFHYVSASPWQIYPSLKPFMDKHYPTGSYSLRDFRLKDSSLLTFLQSSKEYKLEQIRSILQKYPEHLFILVGDSGEHDPEVYAQIYQEFAKNIERILIRAVPKSDLSEARFKATFSEIPSQLWRVVKESDQLN